MNESVEFIEDEWSLSDFQIGKPLGEGCFGKVYLVREVRTPRKLLFAMKILSKENLVQSKNEKSFKQEVENHSILR
jgi:serine/threonine protein kinase